MLKIEMLPAGHGDCLWIEYGDPARPRRILIDGGASGTYQRALRPRLLALPARKRHFELLIVSHVDADHIAGVLDLLQDSDIGFAAQDVWFNGYRHLPDEAPDTMGAVQGERLTELLAAPGVSWNGAFDGGAVVVPDDGALPQKKLPGGLVLTLLSPTPAKLAALKPRWENEVRKAGLVPGFEIPGGVETEEGFEFLGAPDIDGLANQDFVEDAAEANGSSIAMLAEYEGRRLLLAADAHPGVLTAALGRIDPARRDGRGRLAVAACKLPHHASKANVSRELLAVLSCRQYLFSSNGAYFRHPDPQAVARVIKWGGRQPSLAFNYRIAYTEIWAAKALREQHRYSVRYPAGDGKGMALEWD